LFFGAEGLRLAQVQMALYRHLNQIPFGFGLFQNGGQLSALSHPLKDKSNFT
jgi:hypothetical protein